MTTDKSDGHNSLIVAVLAGLSKEGIEKQIRHEFRQGYPTATEAEISLLFDADRKNGSPPWNLRHAREIMARDNVWAFRPHCNSPFGRASHEWHGPGPSAAMKAEEEASYLATRKWIAEIAAAEPITAPKPKRTRHTPLREMMKMVAEVLSGRPPDNSPRPRPTDKEFDDAALAVMRAHRDHRVREAAMARTLKIIARILADADSFDAAPLARHCCLDRSLDWSGTHDRPHTPPR